MSKRPTFGFEVLFTAIGIGLAADCLLRAEIWGLNILVFNVLFFRKPWFDRLAAPARAADKDERVARGGDPLFCVDVRRACRRGAACF